jgi:hypothetical protein
MSFFLDFLEKFTDSMLEKPGGPAPRGMGRMQTQAGVTVSGTLSIRAPLPDARHMSAAYIVSNPVDK